MELPLLILFLVIVIGAPLLKGYLNQKAANFGAQAGKKFAAKRLPAALELLGGTVRLHTSAEAAQQIVEEAMGHKPKRYTTLAPGRYTMQAIDKDDVTFALAPVTGGIELRIVRIKEHMGFPQGAVYWPDLRAAVVKAAEARGVATTEAAVTFARTEPLSERDWAWTVTD